MKKMPLKKSKRDRRVALRVGHTPKINRTERPAEFQEAGAAVRKSIVRTPAAAAIAATGRRWIAAA